MNLEEQRKTVSEHLSYAIVADEIKKAHGKKPNRNRYSRSIMAGVVTLHKETNVPLMIIGEMLGINGDNNSNYVNIEKWEQRIENQTLYEPASEDERLLREKLKLYIFDSQTRPPRWLQRRIVEVARANRILSEDIQHHFQISSRTFEKYSEDYDNGLYANDYPSNEANDAVPILPPVIKANNGQQPVKTEDFICLGKYPVHDTVIDLEKQLVYCRRCYANCKIS
jgi:hypothetical protein